ncbi:MAG: IS200/IS605 family transposase [Marinobacter sp. 34-60-7]|nr:MAG: IS200/IS605 family transposase [Marinobacter sp. 34-60-7]
MGVIRSNHCAYDAHYHLVFPVKYRRALLEPHISRAVLDIAKDIEDRYDITFEKIGTDGDHIHLLCSFHPKYSGSQVVGRFKSITARELFRRFPELRKKLWGGEFWSDGYYLNTVSERGNWKTVERYVANQGKSREKSGQLTLWS